MDILELFKRQLLEDKSTSSKSTLKNYLSDVRHFILWFERTTHSSFEANRVSSDILSLYQKTLGGVIENGNINTSAQLSTASMKRHLSSLRKFFAILEKSNDISINPFVQIQPEITEEPTDFWHLKSFKDFLQLQKSSKITVKNYISDIAGFAKWYEETVLPGLEKPLSSTEGFYIITQEIVEDYRKRLLEIQNAAPRTVNRKLSALRRYIGFATQKGFISPNELTIDPVKLYEEKILSEDQPTVELAELPKAEAKVRSYSKFPPFRLAQKLFIFPYLATEEKAANSIASFILGKPISGIQKLPPKLASIVEAKNKLRINNNSVGNLLGIRNISKDFYAPEKVSLLGTPLYKRAIYHFRYTRPNWYKRYHNYSFVHYVHFALLVIFASGVGVALYQNLVAKKQAPTFAAATAPPRIISFQGRLTDNVDNPITSTSALRFAIYNDSSASGGALLWQEAITNIAPDSDGIFSVLLGQGTQIPSTVFTDNSQIWLGVTVGMTPELSPRQRIASVGYATNAEFLQGQPPTTQAGITSFTNVILALDSSGNLTLADSGTTNHTFQVSNGAFNLKGQSLYLTTNTGSGGNVILSPDGLGKNDIQRPIINSTTMGNLVPGGVEVDDKFGVLATESAVAAFMVNNNTTGGDIFAASSSGTPRFKIANDGTLTDGVYNTAGGIIYGSNTGGTFAQTTAGLLGQCLQSAAGGTPTWGTCGGNSSPFQELTGAIVPMNSTEDLLVGGQSTGAAKFRFINVNTGTPIASISANSGNNATFLSGNGTLGTTNRQTLTLGNSSTFNTTGNLLINPNGIGNIGIGTTSPLIGFDLRGNSGTTAAASISANTSFATLIVDNAGSGDLFTASASGLNRFAITNNGGIKLGSSTGTSSQCITGGTTATWGTCGGGNYSPFQELAGAIVPMNSTEDLLVGGQSTGAAKFRFINVNTGTPVASISANNGNNATFISGAGTISTTNMQSLTVGGATSGQLALNSMGNIVFQNPGTANIYVGQQAGGGASNTGSHNSFFGYQAGFSNTTGQLNNFMGDSAGYANQDGIYNNFIGVQAGVSNVSGSHNTFIGNSAGNNNVNGNANSFFGESAGYSNTASYNTFFGNSAGFSNNSGAGNLFIGYLAGDTGNPAYSNISGSNNTFIGYQAGPGTPTQLSNAGAIGYQAATAVSNSLVLGGTGAYAINVGIGTATPSATLEIDGGNMGGNAALIANQTGATTNDIFTASSAALPRFTITYNGGIGLGGSVNVGTNTQCLLGGTTAFWGSCSASNVFNQANGTIYPLNSTVDFLIGGQATTSAKFAVLNMNTGTPVASISSGLNGAGMYMSANGTLATTSRQTLTLGNSSTYNTTGNLLINPNGIGRIGIGTTSPIIGFDLRGNSGTTPAASISANTSYATLLVDNSGGGDLIAASASGVPNFVVKNNGDVIVGQGGGGKITVSVIDPYLVQNQKTTGTQSLTFQTMGATNADFIFKNTSTTLSTLTQAGQLQLPVTGSTGGIVIGGDTQIFRGSADRLDLASGDSFNVVSGNLQIGGTTVIDSSRNGTFQTLNITGGCTGCTTGAPSPFQAANGAIVPLNGTLDLLVGSQATTSAKFAVLNLGNGGTPTASVSSGLSGSSMYLTADGTLATQNRGNLTIGNSSTYNTSGNVLINPNGTGNIGIGTTSPIAPFHFESSVQNSLTDLAGAAAKTSSLTNLTSTDTSTATLKASAFQLTYDPASNPISSKITSSLHSFVSVPSTNTQNLSNVDLRGFIALADQRGTGTVGIVTGMLGQARNTSTGTVTNLNSISAAATNSNASGTVGTLKYLNLIDLQSSGTITDTYGLYIGDITTGTQTNTPFSIYASDTGTYNYLGGNTGIGTTTPTAKLDVNGTASVSGVFKLYGTPTIQSTANQTLTLGGDTTGNIILSPSNGLGRVGIGTNNPTASLHLFKSGTNDPEAIFENGTGGSIMITSASNTIYQKLINVPGNDNFLTGSLAGDSGIVFANGGNYLIGVSAGYVSQYFKSNNTIGLGTNSPTSELHVTRPLTYGTTGKALAIFDQIENQDILTASSGGTTRFVIKNDGTASSSAGFTIDGSGALQSTKNQTLTIGGDSTGSIVLSPNNGSGSLRFTNFTTNGGVLYTNAAGVLAQTAGGTGTQCLLGNLSWGSCGTGTTLSPFQEANGAIIPFQPSEDFLIGGTSTGSAKFAILNVNNGVPTASVSSGLNGTASLHDANGNFQTANKMTLTLGGGNTGNIVIQGNGTTTIVDQTIRLNAINPTFSANGSSTLTLNNNSTGNIQFFSSSNTLTSAGALSIAGSATINGGTVQLANGAQGTIQTASNADILITAGSGTINLNTVSNGPILTGSGLTTLGGGLTVNGATTTFGNAAPLVTTGTNTDLTITPNGTGNLIITSDFNTGVRIGSSSNIPALLSVSGGIGSNAGFILNRVGTTDDIFAASSSGTTKFVIKNDGTASTSGTFVLDGAGSLQTTKNQTLTIGGNSTGNIVLSPNNGSGNIRFSNFSTNNGLLYTNASGVLSQTAAGTGSQCLLGTLNWGSCSTGVNTSPFQELSGTIVPNNSLEDFLVGGQASSSAKFAVLNMNTGTPVASISANSGNNALYLTGDGTLATTNRQTLTIGSSSTYNTSGNVLINPNGTGNVGIGTAAPGAALDVSGSLLLGANSTIDTRSSGTLTIGNGANTTGLTLGKSGATTTFNSTSWTATPTISGLVTGTLGFSIATGQSYTGAGTVTLSSASNNDLTLTAQGSGNTIITSDFDTGLKIGSSANTIAPLSVSGGIGFNALTILNQTNSGDILAASASGTTKFVIKNDGTASSSAGFTINGVGSIQSTNAQTLTIGGAMTGNLVLTPGGTGTIQMTNFTSNGGVLYTNASGILAQVTAGTASQCLLGGTTPSFNNCPLGYSSPFREGSGSVFQLNTTEDFLAGGQATTSAAFRVVGQSNPFAGTLAAASISANTSFAGLVVDNKGVGDLLVASQSGMTQLVLTNNGALGLGLGYSGRPTAKLDVNGNASISSALTFRTGAASIQATANNTLTIGGNSTGNLIFSPNASNLVGVGTQTPLASFDLRAALGVLGGGTLPVASISGATSFATLAVDNSGLGDLFTASSSGLNRFVIRQNGFIGIGTTQPSQLLTMAGGNFLQTAATTPTIKGSVQDNTNLLGAQNVYVSGKYAYVAASTSARLTIVDVANPASPTVISSVQDTTKLLGAYGIDINGMYAYVTASTGARLTIVDISHPKAPVVKGSIQDNNRLAQAGLVVAEGGFAYVPASASARLNIIDVSNSNSPVIVGSVNDSVNLSGATGVYLQNKYAYVTSSTGSRLAVIDVSNPYAPFLAGTIQDTTQLNGATGIYVSGRYAYVTAKNTNRLTVVDVSTPNAPTIVGSINDQTNLQTPTNVQVAGNYAYVTSTYGNRLTVVDVTTPTAPTIISSINDNTNLNNPFGIYVAGKYAYVPNFYGNRLTVVDINGIDVPAGNIGSLASNSITVHDSVDIGDSLFVRNSLSIGDGGLYSQGNLTIDVASGGANLIQGAPIGRALFSLNYQGTDQNIFTASVSGVTKFAIGNDGTASTSAGFTIDGAGNIQSTNRQTLTIGGGQTGTLIVGQSGAAITLPGFDCSAQGNGGKLTTTAGGVLACSADSGGSVNNWWQYNPSIGTLAPGNLTIATLFGGTASTSALMTIAGTANSGTVPVASISARTSYAGLVVDNTTGDLFTASSSGLNRFVITQNGNVGIGTTTPSTVLNIYKTGVAPVAMIEGEWDVNTENAQFVAKSYSGTHTNSGGMFRGYAFRGTKASPTSTQANDILALFKGGGYTNTQLDDSAGISIISGSNWGASNAESLMSFYTTPNNSTTSLERMRLYSNGNIGIGTVNAPVNTNMPDPKLEIYSTLGTSPAASVSASNTSAVTLLVTQDAGNGDLIAASYGGQTKFVLDNTGEGWFWNNVSGPRSDFAEYYKKDDPNEPFDAGQLVCLAPNGVTKCSTSNPSLKIVGVISDNALIKGNGNHKNDPDYVLVGMVGQLGVWVTGDVKAGDPLTYSSTPGYATVAKTAGNIIGYAKEANNGNQIRVGSIIQPDYYNPNTALQTDSFYNQLSLAVYNNTYGLFDALGNTINHIDAFSKAMIANLEVGFAHIRNLAVDTISAATSTLGNATATTLSVAANTITIGGQDLRQFIIDTVTNAGFGQTNLVSPIASNNIKTNVISPLADNTSPSVSFGNSKVNIQNSSNQTVAWFDNNGNASFSGQLIANTIQTHNITASSSSFQTTNSQLLATNTATVAGTLTAGTIIANNIQGLDQKLATLAAALNNQGTVSQSSSSGQTNQTLASDVSVNSIHANFGIFEQGITSMGPVTANIMTATDSLSVGNSFTISNNSINTVGADLAIQSLRQGNIAFEGGLIRMDTDGNMSINGNLNLLGEIDAAHGVFSGTLTAPALATSLISPLPGDDLSIRLTDSASTSGKLKITNSQNQEVLSVNSSGDLNASGSGTFAKLNFNLVGKAEATSLTEAVATGSAGFATLRQGQVELTIKNKIVTSKSLIYITPFGDTNNKVIYLLRQVPTDSTNGIEGSFTVGISGTPAPQDIQFNWLIVN